MHWPAQPGLWATHRTADPHRHRTPARFPLGWAKANWIFFGGLVVSWVDPPPRAAQESPKAYGWWVGVRPPHLAFSVQPCPPWWPLRRCRCPTERTRSLMGQPASAGSAWRVPGARLEGGRLLVMSGAKRLPPMWPTSLSTLSDDGGRPCGMAARLSCFAVPSVLYPCEPTPGRRRAPAVHGVHRRGFWAGTRIPRAPMTANLREWQPQCI